MKKIYLSLFLFIALSTVTIALSSFLTPNHPQSALNFPYRKGGFTDREAAAHLLNRFAFGPKPAQIDEVVKMGVEKWFQEQLNGSYPEDKVNNLLAGYESLKMNNEQIVQKYPKPAFVLRQTIKESDGKNKSARDADRKDYKDDIKKYMNENGYKPQAEMFHQLINQKILRAAYSDNQLKEILTDFWFNHFNVSITKGEGRQFVMVYERDAIRPNVLGKFENLLMATAKSPAMLTYLDNFRSTGANEKATPQAKKRAAQVMQQLEKKQANDKNMQQNDVVEKIKKAKATQGLNENYAREIMELHTLGVDGGYSQTDVTQAARILTGWTLYPIGEYGNKTMDKMIERIGEERMKKQGFVREGDFLFAANKHDNGEKTFMGVSFPAGGGYEEGEKLIKMLATHPSTAKFISRKLAVRFVSDNPPQSLIDKMAKTFLEKGGDIKEVLITMTNAPEFWTKENQREKTKSPFELAISTVRSLDAKLNAPYQLYTWINKMGQQLYAYQAPTGFPDKSQYWINTGSLLNRMNFGLAIASQRIPGVSFNLIALNNNHEPESAEAALKIYSKILLPERNVDETIKRLEPMLTDPELESKINEAASKTATAKAAEEAEGMMMEDEKGKKNNEGKKGGMKKGKVNNQQFSAGKNTMLSQVVGIIIGSPEFQRK